MDINIGQDAYGLSIDTSEQHGCTWTPEHQYQLRLLPQLLNLNTDGRDNYIIISHITTGKDLSEMLIDTSEQHGCTMIPKLQHQIRRLPQLLNINIAGLDIDYAERPICILRSFSISWLKFRL
jgi:hypothetical protein